MALVFVCIKHLALWHMHGCIHTPLAVWKCYPMEGYHQTAQTGCQDAALWNTLPAEVRQAPSLLAFKNKSAKKHLFPHKLFKASSLQDALYNVATFNLLLFSLSSVTAGDFSFWVFSLFVERTGFCWWPFRVFMFMFCVHNPPGVVAMPLDG